MTCPFCGTPLKLAASTETYDGDVDRIRYGVLKCPCEEYPIVEGIAVVKKGLPKGVPDRVRSGDLAGSLIALLQQEIPKVYRKQRPLPVRIALRLAGRNWGGTHAPGSQGHPGERVLRRLVADRNEHVPARELFAAVAIKPGFSTYLYYKFGQPRHLVGLALVQIMPASPEFVLDLGCGAGHLTRAIQRRHSSQITVGMDMVLGLLLCAKRLIAPEAEYVCCSAESPLPFQDDSFSQVYSFDAFHLLVGKHLCIRELKRIGNADAVLCIGSVRNALVEHPYTRQAQYISPSLLSDLAGNLPHQVVSDEAILTNYLEKRGPSLSSPANADQLAKSELVTLIASRRTDLFREHPAFPRWPHAEGSLGINPLYKAREQDQKIILVRTFPTEQFEGENQRCKSYMPERMSISQGVHQQLIQGSATTEVPEIEDLVNTFVVYDVPKGY